MEPIITSLLDTDFYKFPMQQLFFHRYPEIKATHKFICRTEVDLLPYREEITNEIDKFCELTFTEDELHYLANIDKFGVHYVNISGLFKSDYINFLKGYKPQREHITIFEKNNKLCIEFNGPLVYTILYEVPVLAIINEVYFRNQPPADLKQAHEKLCEKLHSVEFFNHDFSYFEFGTRRRYSKTWQEHVTKKCLKHGYCRGTSNVYLSKKFEIPPIGTMAHELLMAYQGIDNFDLINFQKEALEAWADEYRGKLAIALTDTIGIDTFLKDFDLYLAKLYDGLRQDSGDPFEWGNKVISHYHRLGINPKTKTLIFSDGLSFEKAFEIYKNFHNKTNVGFGIGTNLTNDVGLKPLNIVIKMVGCNGHPTAKISDEAGKETCEDKNYLKYFKKVFNCI